MKKSIQITDLDYSFQAHPVSGNLLIKKGADAIKQSIKTLLFLNIFEKPFSTISANIRNKLFENFNLIVEENLRKDITNILGTYEPRIRVVEVRISHNYENLSIGITYTIIGEESSSEEISLVMTRSR